MIHSSNFEKLVFEQIDQIPYGETRSYKDIAKAIGRPKSYRAVANAWQESYSHSSTMS